MKTVYWRVSDPEHKFVSQFSWAAGMYYPMLNKFFETFFRGDFPNKGKQVYKDHVEEIRRLVPPENLLEYKISDGWAPLCEFLGEEAPYGVDFPKGNDMNDFFNRCTTRNRRQMLNAGLQALTYGASFAALGFGFYAAYKRIVH